MGSPRLLETFTSTSLKLADAPQVLNHRDPWTMEWWITKELEGNLPHYDMLIFYFDHGNNGSICDRSRRVARGDAGKCPPSEIFCKNHTCIFKIISS